MSGVRLTLSLTVLAVPWLHAAEDGFRPIFGGLPFDSGIAAGLEYRKSRLTGAPLEFFAKAIGSVKKYELLEAGVAAPRLAGGLLFAETRVRYRNFPEEDFWGLGAKSSRDHRTTFRLEDLDCTAAFGVRPKRWLEIGADGGVLNSNMGPGKDRDWLSVEQRFAAGEVPALDRQPHYVHAGAFVRADYRDESGDPQRGGFYQFRWTAFHDRDFGRFHFRRYEADLRQFLPSFRDRDTIAVRALAILSEKGSGQQVPFFLQPTVGGGGDLRGYYQYRFRDENALAFNLEHRWRVREELHVVGFADAGRVFGRPGQISLADLRGSAGAGGRILLGVDLGWSPDGLRIWFRGGQSF